MIINMIIFKNIVNNENSIKRKENTNKKIYIEILRCIAIFLVIFNHTGIKGFQRYVMTDNIILHTVYLIMAIICKMAVPIFFMISGALLLNKEESIKTLYKKRIVRIIIVIFIASFIQYLYKIKSDFGTFDIFAFLKTIYTKNIIVPYWFLYSYLGFLIMLPFLRNLVKNMKKEHYYYLFTIYVIYKIIMPIITQQLDMSVNANLKLILLETNIICPIVGHFCENILDIRKINKKMIIFATIALIVVLVTGVTLTMLEVQNTGNKKIETYLSYGSVFIAMYTYILTKSIFYKSELPNWVNNIIITIGGCSFGIYLIEKILRKFMLDKIVSKLSPFIKTMPACLVSIACIICIGTVIIMILKKIPICKKIL